MFSTCPTHRIEYNQCESPAVSMHIGRGREAIEKALEEAPDVVLVDLTMPIMDSAEVTHRIHQMNSNAKVLLLTQYEDRDLVLSGLKAGANGCISKQAKALDLVSAILAVYQGDCFLYPSVAKMVMDDYFQRIKQPGSPDPYDRLTHREKAVLKLVSEDHRSREIANILDIAVKTVMGHRINLMRKLGIHSQTELVKYAIRRGLTKLEN